MTEDNPTRIVVAAKLTPEEYEILQYLNRVYDGNNNSTLKKLIREAYDYRAKR